MNRRKVSLEIRDLHDSRNERYKAPPPHDTVQQAYVKSLCHRYLKIV